MKQYPTFRKLSTFGRRHRKVFVKGALSAAGVVAARLAMPWPLREIADTLSNTVPGSTEPGALYTDIFESAAVFLLAVVAIGLFDFLVRLWFSRFAIATTRDLRQAAFRNALGVDSTSRSAIAGDLVSRLIGDAARVKAGIQGFLVHVATNGLLFLGVTTILFIMSPSLGAIFCLIAVVTAAVTIWGARRLFKMSLLHREKEGQLANKIHSSLTRLTDKAKLKRINKSSGDYDASLTKLQGQITWATHAIFGVCIVVALAVSANSVLAGQLTSGDMVLFILYALTIRGPIVRLARQGTRTGKILGPATRLVQMLEPVPESATGRPQLRLRSLKKTLTLKRIKLDLPASGEATAITVGPLDLTIKRGQRVAIVDAEGRAARALLDVIAGTRLPEEGRVVWDTAVLKGNAIRTLESQVAVAENFPPTSSLALRLKDIAIALRRRASLRIFIDPANEMSQADADQVV